MSQENIIGEEGSNDLYELKEELGSGATSVVYKGIRLKSGQAVAIKKIKNSTKEMIKVVTKEIEIMKQIKHENVVNYITNFKCKGRWYIVLQYCAKGTIQDYLTKVDKIPEFHCRLFTKCILKALVFLHKERKVAHRDLKLANILINDAYQLKIADFGFSRISEINYYQTFCGTPTHMAPEILRGDPYEMNCDVWSLGVVVFIMLYNRQPFFPTKFDGGGVIGMKNVVARCKQKFNAKVKVSDSCKQFINLCLEKDASKRLSSEQLLKHKWISQHNSQNNLNTTKKGIFNILNAKFKDQRDDANNILKKMLVGVFEQHFKKMTSQMQLSEEKISKMIQVLGTHDWGEEVRECCLMVVKAKLQELSSRNFQLLIESYTYRFRFNQVNRFHQYLERASKLVEEQLQKISNKTQNAKFRRKIATFVLNEIEQQMEFTNEVNISEVIPFLKNLCSLVIKQYPISRVIVKWDGNTSHDKLQPFLIHELKILKQDDIVPIINDQPSHNEDLRAMWLIENQIEVKSATDLESQNCQAMLQVLRIPSNFPTDQNLLTQKVQFSESLMDLDKQ